MARAYGFRVFIVEAYPNRIKGNKPVDSGTGSGLADEIALLLRRLQVSGTRRFEPRPDHDGNVTRPVRTATLAQTVVINADLIHATIAVGEEGSHASATKPKKKARNLNGWSAEAPHEVTFAFPKGKESHFFLITQTNYRRDPHSRLLGMLRDESMTVRTERRDADSQIRKAAQEAGAKVPKKKNYDRLLFDVRQASDNDYLDELLTGADAATVVFKSKMLDAVGNTTYVDRVLQIKLRNQNIIEVAQEASRRWVADWRSGKKTTAHDAVSDVAGLLEERDLLEDGEEGRYGTAAITVRGKSTDASTTIAVDSLRDAFTYPLSDIPPSADMYYERLSDRLRKIALQEDIEIETIDPHEVSRCLTDLTPAES